MRRFFVGFHGSFELLRKGPKFGIGDPECHNGLLKSIILPIVRELHSPTSTRPIEQSFDRLQSHLLLVWSGLNHHIETVFVGCLSFKSGHVQ